MNNEQQIAAETLKQLAEQTTIEGVWKAHAIDGIDGKLKLKYKGKTYNYAVEVLQF